MKEGTKKTEILAPIFKKKPSIIVERYNVLYCYNIAHSQTTHCMRSSSENTGFRKRCVFVETDNF